MTDIRPVHPRRVRKIQALVQIARDSPRVHQCVLCCKEDPTVYRAWDIRKDDESVPPPKRGTVAVYSICTECDGVDVVETIRRVSAELSRKWMWEYERELSRSGRGT